MIYGNIFRDILGCLDLVFNQRLLISSIPWNKRYKDEIGVEALMLTQEKKIGDLYC